MTGRLLIGLDFGTASARGVALDEDTRAEVAATVRDYPHGTLTTALPDGTPLRPGWALQVPADYLEVAGDILSKLGRGREVASIGLGFTASSPLPARADGTALADLSPGDPHAYVKLWRHAAQAQADRLSATGDPAFANFGGRVSGEWLLAKALEVAEEAPATWARAERFLEAGDWMVWQLTGREARGQGFAAYKAQWTPEAGYPAHLVPGLAARLAPPLIVGSPAGTLSASWRTRTGIGGEAVVAVAVIDGHVVLPAVGAVADGTFVGALGTSAAYLYQGAAFRPLPPGIEGVARDGALRGLWTYEAGQASFGDTLAWFARLTGPPDMDLGRRLADLDREAAALPPGAGGLLALDWWGGNRVPLADARLGGLLLGLTAATGSAAIHRALAEALCLGARTVLDLFREGGFPLSRVVMTSGLASRSPFLVQLMADVLGHPVEVPLLANATAVGAAIHGAVAAGIVAGYEEGGVRFGAQAARRHDPDPRASETYARLHAQHRSLAADPLIHEAMHVVRSLAAGG